MPQYAQQIDLVRQIAISHINRCGGNPEELMQSFLFSGDHFVGVHFRVAGAEAKWLFGNRMVDLIRGSEVVARMPVEDAAAGSVAKRAA